MTTHSTFRSRRPDVYATQGMVATSQPLASQAGIDILKAGGSAADAAIAAAAMLNIVEPMGNGFRFSEGLALFENRVHVIPQAADDFKKIAQEKLAWLDGLIEGKDYICGDRFTLADILLFGFLEFGAAVGQPLDAKCEHLQAWYARVAARPSIAA